MYLHLSTPTPPSTYTDFEFNMLVLIARSLSPASAGKTPPPIHADNEPLLPEYSATMLRKAANKLGYAEPVWDAENYQWTIGKQSHKAVKV